MGSATILSGGSSGLYNIRLTLDTVKISSMKTAAEARIARIAIIEAEVQTQLTAAEMIYLDKSHTLDDAISAFQNGTGSPKTTRADVIKAQTDASTALSVVAGLRHSRGLLQMEDAALRKRVILLSLKLVPVDLTGVWCADLSTELTGAVGTAEVNGEVTEILVMPSGRAGLGKIQPVLASSPAGVFYNQAVLPGWQKFKPTYRIGTITALDVAENTAGVTLLPALSSAQNLNINQAENLTGVPVVYLT